MIGTTFLKTLTGDEKFEIKEEERGRVLIFKEKTCACTLPEKAGEFKTLIDKLMRVFNVAKIVFLLSKGNYEFAEIPEGYEGNI